MFVDLLYCIFLPLTNLFTGLSRVSSDSFCFSRDSFSFISFIMDRVSVLGGLANLKITFFGFGDSDLNHRILFELTFSPTRRTLLVKSWLFDLDVRRGFLSVSIRRDPKDPTISPVVQVHVRQWLDVLAGCCWTLARFSFVIDVICSINLNNWWEEKDSQNIRRTNIEIKGVPEWESFEETR